MHGLFVVTRAPVFLQERTAQGSRCVCGSARCRFTWCANVGRLVVWLTVAGTVVPSGIALSDVVLQAPEVDLTTLDDFKCDA